MEPVTTLLSAAAIVALVNIAKDLGVASKWAPLLAILFGVGISVASTYLEPGLWQTISRGLLVALSASGVRDLVTTPATPERAIRRAVDGA
ncbi:MAG: hypothetical protein QM582_00845 [Micropruina sp.]|uniref:hypothetical protein n=1 Tax=Micropruina sp. TaxID=2737536 RepID=UPI0039E32EF0